MEAEVMSNQVYYTHQDELASQSKIVVKQYQNTSGGCRPRTNSLLSPKGSVGLSYYEPQHRGGGVLLLQIQSVFLTYNLRDSFPFSR